MTDSTTTAEGIVFNGLGTIDVTFDGKTYHLGRPKLRQWRYFMNQIETLSAETRDTLNELSKAVAEASNAIEDDVDPVLVATLRKAEEEAAKEGATNIDVQVREKARRDVYNAASELCRARFDEASEALQAFAETPFYNKSSGLLRDMFDQLGDGPLPDDLDDWPVWLATDTSLPGRILTHWRTNPKASGPTNSS